MQNAANKGIFRKKKNINVRDTIHEAQNKPSYREKSQTFFQALKLL